MIFCKSKDILTLGCPKMTQLLKCYAPSEFSGAKILVILEIGHKIEID